MYTIALFTAIGAIIGSFIAGIFGAIVGALIGAVVGLIVACTIISELVPMKNVVSKSIKLVAMRSSDGISGTFIWGSGAMSNRTTYNFMQLVEDGSMVPGWLPANHLVHLIEDAELKNTGSWCTTTREADKTSSLYRWAIGSSDRTETVRQEFRVPVGTVVQQFSVK
ncbi:MAG: hypothetical protein WC028_23980 [Candidatus Obscuribacterales bacterium]|jgi:hypothetical protein